jgi:protein MBA1
MPVVKQQDCTEYIVLQKLRWIGEEEDWRIWGHTTPTTVDDLSTPFFASGLTLAERMEAMKDAMGGNK